MRNRQWSIMPARTPGSPGSSVADAEDIGHDDA
jgi:hypothetical protein